jgi:hypothetical protein
MLSLAWGVRSIAAIRDPLRNLRCGCNSTTVTAAIAGTARMVDYTGGGLPDIGR